MQCAIRPTCYYHRHHNHRPIWVTASSRQPVPPASRVTTSIQLIDLTGLYMYSVLLSPVLYAYITRDVCIAVIRYGQKWTITEYPPAPRCRPTVVAMFLLTSVVLWSVTLYWECGVQGQTTEAPVELQVYRLYHGLEWYKLTWVYTTPEYCIT